MRAGHKLTHHLVTHFMFPAIKNLHFTGDFPCLRRLFEAPKNTKKPRNTIPFAAAEGGCPKLEETEKEWDQEPPGARKSYGKSS